MWSWCTVLDIWTAVTFILIRQEEDVSAGYIPTEENTLALLRHFVTTGGQWTFITSHHIEKTDAGLDRPLYLRNKLYDETLKSQNYYSIILRFAVPWRSALWLCNTSWLDQNLYKPFLKQLTVSAGTTWFESLFHGYSRLLKLNFLKS